MFKMSENGKLVAAEGMYILVVAIMIGFVFLDTDRINFGSTVKISDTYAVVNNTQADTEFNKYYNDRYGFSIDYPSNFTKLSEDTSVEGNSFISEDKSMKVTVYGSNNIPYEPAEMLLKKDLSIIDGDLKYKTSSKDWYELSWVKDKVIYYRRVKVGTEALNSLIISYPSNASASDNSIIKHIISSFKNGNLETAH